MKKNILLVASGSFLALHGVSAAAQEAPADSATIETETTTATPTTEGQGAVVTRESTTTTTTDMGEVTSEIDAMQTVETPAGNATVVARTKDEDGKTTVTVDHSKMDHSANDATDSENNDADEDDN